MDSLRGNDRSTTEKMDSRFAGMTGRLLKSPGFHDFLDVLNSFSNVFSTVRSYLQLKNVTTAALFSSP